MCLELNQRVWRRNKSLSDAARHFNAKLAPGYLGPYWIKKKVGSAVYELMDGTGKSCGIWHVQDIKPYLANDDGVEPEMMD